VKKRVVITGMGAITPLGNTVADYWNALLEGKSGITKVTAFDASDYATQIAGEVKGFEPGNYMDKKEARRMDRCTQFAVACTRMAIDDAKLDLGSIDCDRAGTIIGTGIGGMETLHDQYKVLFEKGPNRISPFFVPMMIANMASGLTSITFGLQGPCLTVVTACATGTNSIGEALRIIQHGDADIMVCGGTEATISPAALAGFCSMKALSTRNDDPEKASRPFEAGRDGFVMGEGCGVIILEELEHAKARGAKIYAELAGYGTNADAYHITAPAPEGTQQAKVMAKAIADAGLKPSDVDYVNAHGTSTPLNDKNETLAIKSLFGDHAKKLAVSSTKSMTGHLLGAAGGIECIACALTVHHDIIHPTINYDNPDPELDLDYVPNKARKQVVNVAISNSFGFGGHNATILVKKYRD
jgi:3-oxoacyl-[acyl-carrier-protein] synthase II